MDFASLTEEQLAELLTSKPYVRLLAELTAADPSAPALTVDGVTLTRAELESRSNQWARALAEKGAVFGDFVTLALPNSVDYFLALIATWKVGAVPQPVSPVLPQAERQAIVDLADSRLVIGADQANHPGRTCLPPGFAPAPGTDGAPLPEVVAPAAKAPTSGGSTGRPKLIVSGTPAETSPAAISWLTGMLPNETQLVCGPLYHNAPLINSINGLILGHHVIVLRKFDAHAALQAIGEHRVTYLQVVPTMMLRMHRLLQEAPEGTYDLSSVRQMWHMAAPCPPWLKQAWIDRLGAEQVMELYGGTEGQAVTRLTGTEWLEHRGTVGKPFFGEMKVLDDEGNELGPGEIGEIYMRSPVGTPASYRYIGAEAKSRDGWDTLGDLGWKDEDGYLYISDRRLDLILSGGANVYPAEVEAAIESHPDVHCCVVVGVPDDDLGQRVHAVVQTDTALDADTLRSHLADRIVRYKIPRSFEFTPEALRDDAGKVRRSAVRDAVAARLTNV